MQIAVLFPGGRRLTSIEHSVYPSIQSLEDYIEKKRWRSHYSH